MPSFLQVVMIVSASVVRRALTSCKVAEHAGVELLS
jgi:hypothetical protein